MGGKGLRVQSEGGRGPPVGSPQAAGSPGALTASPSGTGEALGRIITYETPANEHPKVSAPRTWLCTLTRTLTLTRGAAIYCYALGHW